MNYIVILMSFQAIYFILTMHEALIIPTRSPGGPGLPRIPGFPGKPLISYF